MNEVIDKLKEYLDADDERRKESWDIRKYFQLLSILKEAKQLAKELDDEINRINPDFSALEKMQSYQPYRQESV